MLKGIRGATTSSENTRTEILLKTKELLEQICRKNEINPENIASVLFTMTPDLDAVFPAEAAREIGWSHVPLMCFQEIDVIGSLPTCIRVLVHYNCKSSFVPVPVYLHEAKALRKDLNTTQ